MINVGVVGSTGYAGAELIRILSKHPNVKIKIITSRQYVDKSFSDIYPCMKNIVNIVCKDFSESEISENADVIFVALPHKLSMAVVEKILKFNNLNSKNNASQKKVIDLSADFRFENVLQYEEFYQEHTATDLLKQAVYGLSEINYNQIKEASLIGNPGCYPTSALLPLIPLISEDLLDENSIIIDSKSGVTGAGRTPSLTTHFCEANESNKPYKVACHRHQPEIEEKLSKHSKKKINITFVPHLVPLNRGIQTTIYANLRKKIVEKDINYCLKVFYNNCYFIRICNEGETPDTKNVRGSNFCDIGYKIDKKNNRLILMSAIDNLIKGAAGQAVQNMNIMLGLDEKLGLDNVPFSI